MTLVYDRCLSERFRMRSTSADGETSYDAIQPSRASGRLFADRGPVGRCNSHGHHGHRRSAHYNGRREYEVARQHDQPFRVAAELPYVGSPAEQDDDDPFPDTVERPGR